MLDKDKLKVYSIEDLIEEILSRVDIGIITCMKKNTDR